LSALIHFANEITGIQEPAKKKVFLSPMRSDTWERTAGAQFGFTVEIDPHVREVRGGETIECHAICIGAATSLKAVVRAIPKIPRSFAVGIEAILGNQIAHIQVPRIATPESIKNTLSVRWGLQIQFRKVNDAKPTVWVHNTRYEVELVVPCQKPKMTEEIIAQREAEKRPQMLDIMLAISPTTGKKYPSHIQIPASATWDDLVMAWYRQAELVGFEDRKRFPTVAASYDIRGAKGGEALNLTDSDRIIAVPIVAIPDAPQAAPTPSIVIPQIHVTIIGGGVGKDRVCSWQRVKVKISPEESERKILEIWRTEVLTRDRMRESWRASIA
jgi:hypothetical protein